MRFFKIKRYQLVSASITAAVGIILLLNITQKNQKSISETDVRYQLEQMYDAEVAGVTFNKGVYKAVITKSGEAYLVEMNAITGDVYSLAQTGEFIVEKDHIIVEKSIGPAKGDIANALIQPIAEKRSDKENTINVEVAKPPARISIIENFRNVFSKVIDIDKTSLKLINPVSSPVEEKLAKEIVKDANKESLKSESGKNEEGNIETAKEETLKAETGLVVDITKENIVKEDKTEVSKAESVKSDSSNDETKKTETSKVEESKKEETQPTVAPPQKDQTDIKKTETEIKTAMALTVLISEEQAIKIAQQQNKGTIESSSFVKTNEGGYYLIVMTVLQDNDLKESRKDKGSKATIQVHAISGKVLSITWE